MCTTIAITSDTPSDQQKPLQHELMLRLSPELEAPVHPHDCCAPQQAPASRAAGEAPSAADAAAASSYAAGGANGLLVDSGTGDGAGASGAPAASGQGRDHGGVSGGSGAGGRHLGRKELREEAGGASAAPAAAAAVRPACTCIWLAEDAKKLLDDESEK